MKDPRDFEEYLKAQKEQFYARDRDARFLVKAFGRCLYELALKCKAEKGNPDLEWVHEELMAEMDSKFQTKLKAMDIGGMIALLVGHGSSIEQAKEAVAQWYVISEKKARDAYNLVLEDFGIKDKSEIIGNRDFRMTFIYEPSSATRRLRKPFPKDYPAAYEAYREALKAEAKYAASGPKSFEDQGA